MYVGDHVCPVVYPSEDEATAEYNCGGNVGDFIKIEGVDPVSGEGD